MAETKRRVLIGCPVRNRGWILPRYLKCVSELDYPAELISYAFIVNDSSDDTFTILSEFKEKSAAPVYLTVLNLGNRNPYARGGTNIKQLVVLRNHLLEFLLTTDCTHLFSVDSDILVPPDALSRLMSHDLPVVSALVRNDHHISSSPGYYNILEQRGGMYYPLQSFPRGQVIKVDCTGAVYLIQRHVIEKGVRYSWHLQGEDVGFCENARGMGIELWCDTGLECEHIMVP